MERHKRARRVTRQSEHGHVTPLRGYGCECSRLARLDLHAPKVDRAVEVPLEDGLEEVARAHACAAGREDEVGLLEASFECGDVFVETK
jgi:hypothetical protein